MPPEMGASYEKSRRRCIGLPGLNLERYCITDFGSERNSDALVQFAINDEDKDHGIQCRCGK